MLVELVELPPAHQAELVVIPISALTFMPMVLLVGCPLRQHHLRTQAIIGAEAKRDSVDLPLLLGFLVGVLGRRRVAGSIQRLVVTLIYQAVAPLGRCHMLSQRRRRAMELGAVLVQAEHQAQDQQGLMVALASSSSNIEESHEIRRHSKR